VAERIDMGDGWTLDVDGADGETILRWADRGSPHSFAAVPPAALLPLILALVARLPAEAVAELAKGLPRVAGAWERDGATGARYFVGTDEMACGYDQGEHIVDNEWYADDDYTTPHPTREAAEAACDERLRAAGVLLMGEVRGVR